jgi:hypothetical protein
LQLGRRTDRKRHVNVPQENGALGGVQIDKTDGINVYLSEKCLECQFATSLSQEMNVCFPDPEEGFRRR